MSSSHASELSFAAGSIKPMNWQCPFVAGISDIVPTRTRFRKSTGSIARYVELESIIDNNVLAIY